MIQCVLVAVNHNKRVKAYYTSNEKFISKSLINF